MASTERNDEVLMRGKVLLVIALYMILGVIGFINFGFQDYVYEFVGWRTSTHESVKQKLTKGMNIQNISPEQSPVSSPEQVGE